MAKQGEELLRLPALARGLAAELRLVEDYLAEFLRTDLATGQVAEVFAAVRDSRGKMLRPTLLLLAARFGPDYPQQKQRLAQLGALIELVHLASLIHDDVIDDSPLRRGQPSLQQRFGKDMAVYAGDFLLSRVMQQLFRLGLTEAGLELALTIEEMCRGELGQMACRWDLDTTVESYLRNIRQKTVTLFATALRLGARESGSSERQAEQLAALGGQLGYMFQLRDDMLDFLEQTAAGKPAEQDFAAGIYTLPLLYALAAAPRAARLRQLLREGQAGPLCEAKTRELRQLVAASGGLEFTQAQIANHATQARRQLAQLSPQAGGAGLARLIEWLEQPPRQAKSLLRVVK